MDKISRHEGRRWLSRRNVLAGLPLATLPLSSCGMVRRGFDYSYRLTLAVKANGATHTGSSVVRVHQWNEQTIDEGWMTQTSIHGEATTVPLGNGGVLATLLLADGLLGPVVGWRGPPTGILRSVYGIADAPFSDKEAYDAAAQDLAYQRGPRDLTAKQLPALVAFLRADDPNSGVLVDPGNLAASLGASVSLRAARIEVTDSPVTHGIEHVLPWLDARLEAQSAAHGSYFLSTTQHPAWFIGFRNVPFGYVLPTAFKS